MNYWLVKSEPDTYSWNDFIQKNIDRWDGVRNYTARNNLRSMELNDLVLFYHSVKKPAVVGIAKVVRTHYPDPTATEPHTWVSVDFEAVRALTKPVSLALIKQQPVLATIPLLRLSRLSVMPLLPAEFEYIVGMELW